MTKIDEKNVEELQNISVDIEEINEANIDSSSEDINDNTSDIPEETILGIDIPGQLAKKTQECEEYLDILRRTKADFDNYRKRTIKEKEGIYNDGFVDGVKQVLPVIDSLERAIGFNTSENDSLLQGVEMVLKMFCDILSKNEIEEIPAEGENFNPHFHNAVMHIEDPNYEENVVVEVLEKGYKFKEKILRYSMVKVAN